jgi:carboxymethylenebutenolidase
MNFLKPAGLRRRSIAVSKCLLRAAVFLSVLAAGNSLRSSNQLAARPNPAQMGSPSVDAQMVKFSSGDASVAAYLAKPGGAGKHAAVIIAHDSGGLNDAAQELTKRFAEAGFVTLTPDLVFRSGDAKPRQEIYMALGRVPLTRPVDDLKAAFSYLQQDPTVDSTKISVVGIGWGGWRAFKLAEDTPALYRAVIFYGQTPDDDSLKKIHVPILAHYAQYDFHVTGNAIWTEDQLGKTFKDYVYADSDRGFFVDGGPGSPGPTAGNVAAAKLAWTRTLEFLKH